MDSDLGLVELNIAPGCEEDVAQVLSAEGKNLQLRPVYIENPPDPFYERGNPKADFHGSRVPPWNDNLYEIPCGIGLQPRLPRLQADPTEEKVHEMIEEKCPVGKTG
jgi:hypothetical protein